MTLETVRTYTTRGDAEVAWALLDSAGIQAIVVADDEGGLNPGFYRDYGVRVVVRPEALGEARKLLGVLVLDSQVISAVQQHALFCAPQEACGLLAMDDTGSIAMVYCCTNAEASTEGFTVPPAETFGAIRHAERNGWEVAGVFHSHPATGASPSPTDVANWPDPSWIQLIVGRDGSVHAFRLVEGRPEQIPVEPSR